MTVYRVLADIVDALRTSRLEHEAIRQEMAEHSAGLRKLGLEFETFRHNSKITLDMILELMTRTNRHEGAQTAPSEAASHVRGKATLGRACR
jgi:hypothetical protein